MNLPQVPANSKKGGVLAQNPSNHRRGPGQNEKRKTWESRVFLPFLPKLRLGVRCSWKTSGCAPVVVLLVHNP